MMPMWNTWGFGMFFMFAFWIVLIACLVFAVRWAMQHSREGPSERGGDAPLDILKRRYARGEIDRDEFDRMRRELR